MKGLGTGGDVGSLYPVGVSLLCSCVSTEGRTTCVPGKTVGGEH